MNDGQPGFPPELPIAANFETALRWAAEILAHAGVSNPEIDARALLAHATGLTHAGMISRARETIDPRVQTNFAAMIARRRQREPVGRIIGHRGFWTCEIALSSETLEPRPDTETLVDFVIGRQRDRLKGQVRILDLGTGSGAILCALLSELCDASGLGVDLSSQACETARTNISKAGLAMRCQIQQSDWFDSVEGSFDLIVSNPPYIPSSEIAWLDPEVRNFDPILALDGGTDGLDAYRTIARGISSRLAPDGRVVVEIGLGQADEVSEIFRSAGYEPDGFQRDLQGHVRVLGFCRSERDLSLRV